MDGSSGITSNTDERLATGTGGVQIRLLIDQRIVINS
jgi:hypothetical protein